uniref:hypothetical protein n=1 Tax=Prevotella sp. TaxID=59823 RepID=UPI0027E39666
QYGLVIYGLSSIHDAKINNNIESLKTQQYYLIHIMETRTHQNIRFIQNAKTRDHTVAWQGIYITWQSNII